MDEHERCEWMIPFQFSPTLWKTRRCARRRKYGPFCWQHHEKNLGR